MFETSETTTPRCSDSALPCARRAIVVTLGKKGIVVGVNGASYTPLDMRAGGLTEIVRASGSYFNTEEEIGYLSDSVALIAETAPPPDAIRYGPPQVVATIRSRWLRSRPTL